LLIYEGKQFKAGPPGYM